MYSAAISHSLIVALMPRFSITGTSTRPTSFSRSKFCMLRVPIWMTSTLCSRNVSSIRTSISSVTIGSPCRAAALRSIASPSTPLPWNA